MIDKIDELQAKLEKIVCVVPPDDGVVLLSSDGAVRWDEKAKCSVYLHEHFSALGDALIDLHSDLKAFKRDSVRSENIRTGCYSFVWFLIGGILGIAGMAGRHNPPAPPPKLWTGVENSDGTFTITIDAETYRADFGPGNRRLQLR